MVYLIETYWVWSLVALACGCAAGYWWLSRLYRHPALAWAIAGLAVGLAVSALQLLPGRAGLYLEALVFMVSAFLVGLLVGGWLRRSTLIPQARTEDSLRAADAAEGLKLAAETQAAAETRAAAAASAAVDARLAAEAKVAEEARKAAVAKAAEPAREAPKVAGSVREAPKAAEDAPSTTEGKAAAAAASAAAHPGVKPPGIAGPRDGKADDLKLIRGIGPKNAGICNELGVFHLAQIAEWSADEATWVGHHLAFPGRIEREHWIDQARLLAAGVDTEHSAGVKAGTIQVDSTADAPLDDAEAAALSASLPAPSQAVEGEAAHHGRRPYGLLSPRHGVPDTLQRIRGIGPQNEKRLHALGIWHFAQIAAWSAENVLWVGSYLAFPGRIDREKWIAQAKDLAAGRDSEPPPKGKRGKHVS